MAISATVTIGNRASGMLSLTGKIGRDYPRAMAAELGVRGEWACAAERLRHVLIGVIGGAHERPGGDVVEAELIGGCLERGELVGVPVAHDGQMALGRAQVLPDGEHLHAVLAQRAEGLDHLVVGLAEPDHQPGLGHDPALAQLASEAQDTTGARELRAAPGDGIQARNDLDVVVEHVGALGDDLGERHLLSLEVGGEHLDLAAGRLAAHLADDADERGGALVGQVVAVDGRDDGVAQAHARDRAGDAGWLERVVPGGLAGLDVAEAAAPRAGVAEDHERGGAALPALADVGAGGLLADGVQVLGADQLGELAVAPPAGWRHLEPRRLALAQRTHVGAEHAQHICSAGVGARAGGNGAGAVAHAGTACTGVDEIVLMGTRCASLVGFAVSIPRRHGETRRWRRPCAVAKWKAMRRRKQGMPALCRGASSLASEVMATSGSPQATTQAKGSRSLWTLTANPCVVTPRETCKPIEAI